MDGGTHAVCPSCSQLLTRGALRCAACGADARRVRGVFALESFFDERAQRLIGLFAELERVDLEVARWLMRRERPRPPRPLCDARAVELLEQIWAITGEMQREHDEQTRR
jgi:hypothetical protein